MKDHTRLARWTATAVAALFVTLGCSSSNKPGGGTGPAPGGTTGVFVDSPVEGLEYTAGTTSGLTDAQGRFDFGTATTIEFRVGDIVIGQGTVKPVMTPVDLVPGALDETDPTVVNIARFLQTIDDDGDPSNGIQISAAVRAAAIGLSIDFAQDPFSFESDPAVVAAILALTTETTAGARTLVPSASAQLELRAALIGNMAGDYAGNVEESGGGENNAVIGNFSVRVDAAGGLSGSITVLGTSHVVNGTVASDGSYDAYGLGGASVYGTIEYDSRPGKTHGWKMSGVFYDQGTMGSLHGEKK